MFIDECRLKISSDGMEIMTAYRRFSGRIPHGVSARDRDAGGLRCDGRRVLWSLRSVWYAL